MPGLGAALRATVEPLLKPCGDVETHEDGPGIETTARSHLNAPIRTAQCRRRGTRPRPVLVAAEVRSEVVRHAPKLAMLVPAGGYQRGGSSPNVSMMLAK